jgi:hypothetical protein
VNFLKSDSGYDKADAREILELRAKEVSLVDRPAILRQFLVIKRQETNMGAFDPKDGQTALTVEKMLESISWSEFDVEKALPIDLRNAIKTTLAFLKKPEDDVPTDALDRVAAFLGKVVGGKYPDPQTKTAKADSTCPKCGKAMKDGACTGCDYTAKATAKTKEELAAEAKAAEEAAKAKGKGVCKSSELNIKISPEGEVEISGDSVSKWLKGFTADRSKTLAAVVKSLLTMLAEVDGETTKSIIDDLTKSLLPANIQWTSGTTPLPASVTKDLGDLVSTAIANALAPVTKRLDEVGGKVEEISKSRTAPSSDGGNHTDKIKKNDSNFWGGLPLR